jgi:hypothetical protein
MEIEHLPAVDEHTVTIGAAANEVWPALLETVERSFSRPAARRYASLVGCSERIVSGRRPLQEGAAVPGFRVVAAVPGYELVLRGRHRFSSYALTFRIEPLAQARVRLSLDPPTWF